MRPSPAPVVAEARTASRSPESGSSRDRYPTPKAWAATTVSPYRRMEGRSHKMATRDRPGTASFSSSSRLAASSPAVMASPVTFPPGRARLATYPFSTGSWKAGNTIGIMPDACSTARKASAVVTTMTSGSRATSSAARSGIRSS